MTDPAALELTATRDTAEPTIAIAPCDEIDIAALAELFPVRDIVPVALPTLFGCASKAALPTIASTPAALAVTTAFACATPTRTIEPLALPETVARAEDAPVSPSDPLASA